VGPLDELRPLRAYRDRVNLVIVLDEGEEVECGLYVTLPVSSYIPVSGDGWEFTPKGALICFYERKRSRSPRVLIRRSANRDPG
jgi:hypothetical protein